MSKLLFKAFSREPATLLESCQEIVTQYIEWILHVTIKPWTPEDSKKHDKCKRQRDCSRLLRDTNT